MGTQLLIGDFQPEKLTIASKMLMKEKHICHYKNKGNSALCSYNVKRSIGKHYCDWKDH